MQWTVSVVQNNKKIKKLGLVEAAHQPEALRKAWDTWPNELQPTKVQGGFSVIVADTKSASD